ncbi:MAG: hypothetical protein FJX47_19660, partial [Alphaproteobacteria bacterium]|nr:hypothetical protein [Alphaproteobacteria bacterium]
MTPAKIEVAAPEATTPETAKRIRAELIGDLYSINTRTRYTPLLVLLALDALQWAFAPQAALVVVTIAYLVGVAAFDIARAAYYRAKPGPVDAPRWGWIYGILSLWTGSCWGMLAAAAMPIDQLIVDFIAFLAVALMVSASATTRGYFLPAHYLFMAGVGWPLVALLIWMNDTTGYLILGIIGVYFFSMSRWGAGQFETYFRTGLLRHHHDLLIGELRQALDKAEAAAVAKSRFLANVSHEIRTPAHGVLATLELLDRGGQTGEARERLLGMARNSANALLLLIEDVLDFSRIEEGRFVLSEAPFSPPAAIKAAVEAFRPAAMEKRIDLSIAVDPSVPRGAVGDELRLRQVIGNLVGNAVKFTEKGRVEVLARAEAMEGRFRLAVEVRDTGIGIDPDKIARLFEPFGQGDDSITRRFGGAGLGLSISREL